MKQDSYYFHRLPKIAQIKASNQIGMETNWRATLDKTVMSLAEQWKLKLGNVLDGGTENLILEATRDNGQLAILKVALPGSSIESEAMALNTANGNGYVHLYAVDYSRGALLLERLGKPLSATSRNIEQHIHIICATLKKAWVKPDSPLPLLTSMDQALQIKTFIEDKWIQFAKPFSLQTLSLAIAFIEARINAFNTENCFLVHGDAHGFNTLEARNGEFKFVDPDGLIADKGYDLICVMRDWSEPLLYGNTLELLIKRCALLAKLTDVDEVSIWQWGYLGRLVIGLTLLELGDTDRAKATLEVADRISHFRMF